MFHDVFRRLVLFICFCLQITCSNIWSALRRYIAWKETEKAFRVTPAVTKVDSLLRASSDSESLSALKSNMGDREI